MSKTTLLDLDAALAMEAVEEARFVGATLEDAAWFLVAISLGVFAFPAALAAVTAVWS